MSRQERLAMLAVPEKIGGETTTPTGQIRFHVLPEDSFAVRSALGAVTVDAKVAKELIEDWAKATVLERVKELKIDKVIEEQMERRVEVAVKTVMASLEKDVLATVRDTVISRAKEAASNLKLEITVKIG